MDALLATPRQFEHVMEHAAKKIEKVADKKMQENLHQHRGSHCSVTGALAHVAEAALMIEEMKADTQANAAEVSSSISVLFVGYLGFCLTRVLIFGLSR